ncbi:MAG TPA: Asp-tRNA(Asn)/Glu-tRNA(Gln) amidotransferase subunit GatA [Thermodesulfobacteriota bacterium]|nr:Asp-tRNA(Asn)/Glu-tRNA(Gln) amidotransferase subunit GatA [Thermodesulfobacteriota bacterium]
MELPFLTIREVSELIRKGEISPVELTESVLRRIEEVDGRLNSYITVLSDHALRSAREAEKTISSGRYIGPLHGVPIGLKDIFVMKGVRTTCGSKILEDFIPPYDATVTLRLKNAGAIIVGKNNMDEFAMGSSTENSYFGPTRNPWDLERVPGGSSGGSAASVSASLCFASIGTDTGGSIRQPAALCGIVGLKPTYGRVSRFGMIAFASSLDQGGPLAKTVEDAALVLNAVAGGDPRDSTSVDVPVPDYTKRIKDGVKGVRIGVPKEYFIEGIDAEVEEGVKRAIALVEDLGGVVEEISLPHTRYAVSAYYIIAPSEASSNLARYDGVRYGFRSSDVGSLRDMYSKTRAEGFGNEVKRRIMIGTYALSAGYYDAYYLKAQRVRTLIKRDFEEAFKKVDVIMTPTSPEPAFKIGEKTDDPLKMYLSDIFTIPCNLAGLPGISIPCGFTSSGLPIGVQILGKPFDEETLLRVANAYELHTNWREKRPPI